MVKEDTLNRLNVPVDTTSHGDIVDRDVGIQLENRQRAKTLTNESQIAERREILFN